MSYIKLDRKMLNWGWSGDPNVVALWIHILLNANYKPNNWQGITVGEGELVTSLARLSLETGLSVQQTRTCLKKLVSTNEITCKSTNKYSIIHVNKWKIYQADGTQSTCESTSQPTNEQQHLKNNKKTRSQEKEIHKERPTLDEVRSYCQERNNGVDADRWFNYYSSNGWKVGKNPMKDWKAAVRTWERNTQQEDTLPTYDVSHNKQYSEEEEEELMKLVGGPNYERWKKEHGKV